MVKAVRGFTVIEELDLNKLPTSYFEPISEYEHRKFGCFSCFGGQIRLTLHMDRSAFVCGEGMTIVGDDVIVINLPIIIGSKPLMNTLCANSTASKDNNTSAVYRLCKHDRAISLLDSKERTLCNKAQLQHLNMYPFYSDLSTSSKQSKRLGVIATAIRAENKMMNTILSTVIEDRRDISMTDDCTAVTSCNTSDVIDSDRALMSTDV
ncbi:hypothetical protein DICVIV_09179 [Dictyocaulus viviparus]|uniref:Uncharacterized protein n=1 Tax=Dictyocaulus viviparus TaxID=29172 RepID=A0A0D8XM33_DICVI|nr:hypothetical protein DICVIV_09179 [Dictyocaulus viviparus]